MFSSLVYFLTQVADDMSNGPNKLCNVSVYSADCICTTMSNVFFACKFVYPTTNYSNKLTCASASPPITESVDNGSLILYTFSTR